MNNSVIKYAATTVLMLGLILFFMYGCKGGGGSGNPLGPTGVSISIDVNPSSLTIARGGTQTFTASGGTGTYSWSVSDASLASIDASSGAFTAGSSAGTITVTATDTAGRTGSTSITIVSATITLIPASVSLGTGDSQTFAASGGTGTYTWSISDTSLGAIDISSGAFTAGSLAGTITVTATDSAGSIGIATITIASVAVTITPSSVTVGIGGTQTFTAAGGTGTYTWSISDTSLGTIDSSTGSFTAGASAGTVTVTATDTEGSSGSATVTVAITTVTVLPASLTIEIGGTQTFSAIGGAEPYTWSVSNTAFGNINAISGLFTALSVGSAIVTAVDAGGSSASSTITIVSTPIVVSPAIITVPNTSTLDFTHTFTATGGTGTYSFNLGGITNSYAGASINLTSGVLTITAIPTSDEGTQTLTVTATDTLGNTGSASVTVQSVAIPSVLVSPLTHTFENSITVPVSLTYTASGGTTPYTFTITGETGGYTGVSIVAATGVLTVVSIPGSVGTQTITITATDAVFNTGTATLIIKQE